MKKIDSLVWVIYDIVSDKVRRKLIKATKKAGLYRVQKSVFLGSINKNDLDELSMIVDDLINKKKDSVYMFPMCEPDFKKVILKGQAFDKKMVTDEIRSLMI